MTEWEARSYAHESALQKWVADASLATLTLAGTERALDLGCGDGKITAAIAVRLPEGSVLGIDPSADMIAFARARFPPAEHRNLTFEVGDARTLQYREAFDLIVSFNALHWVVDQAAALHGIRDALTPGGRTLLQFVPDGERTCLEDVIEETRRSPRWARCFTGSRTPYVHFTPEQYRALAARCGLRVEHLDIEQKIWDFKTREAFVHFAEATFIEWTRMITPGERATFINDVLDRYRRVGDGSPEQENAFFFYQMRVALQRA